MDPIVGQKHKVIMDMSRTIQCGTCSRPQTVEAAIERAGECPSCQSEICVLCGCTERAACIRTAADHPYSCSWIFPQSAESFGLPNCCDFCFQQMAEFFYLLATSREPKPFEEPIRPAVI